MKRHWPLILVAVGTGLVLAGLVYDVMFAGIPYQDPMPEISESYARHSHIASLIRWLGAAVLNAGMLAAFVRLAVRRFRRVAA